MFLFMPRGVSTRANGMPTNEMEGAFRFIRVGLAILANLLRIIRTEKESTLGAMEKYMMENGTWA